MPPEIQSQRGATSKYKPAPFIRPSALCGNTPAMFVFSEALFALNRVSRHGRNSEIFGSAASSGAILLKSSARRSTIAAIGPRTCAS